MTIVTVEPGSALLHDVMSLGRQNAKTLGFFPKGAFLDYATRGHVRAYVHGEDVAGYLVFRIHHLTVILVHLCVDNDFRGRGISRALVDHLCQESAGFAGIRAACRVDFAADAMWSRLGFVARSEKPGRAIRGPTRLRVWWRDLGLPDLFSTAPSDRVVAALDTNVLLDLHGDPSDPQRRESKALLADWLDDSIEFVVTAEVSADISRNPVPQERQALFEFASTFRSLSDQQSALTQELLTQLSDSIGAGDSPQDRSDRRQLALSAVGGAGLFVTRDEGILGFANDIDEILGIAVLRPCDLIARTHAELTEQSFASRPLFGSALSVRPFRANEIDDLAGTFQAFDQREKKGPFVGVLRNSLAHSDRSMGLVIFGHNERPHGLLVTDADENETRIRLLRTTRGAVSDVLARHLVWLAVREACRAGHGITRLMDTHVPTAANGVLGVLGFRPANRGMAKVNGIGVRTTLDLASDLKSVRSIYPNQTWSRRIEDVLMRDRSQLSHQLAFECERVAWPAKLLDTTLPSFVVPIKPEWAAQLFHAHLAEQSLFGSDPRLMLRLDNVYYRSAVPKRIEAPARVLWYVTASKERPSTKCIAATSLVSEVVHGPAKEVFSRFKRYGVFGWKDVLGAAGGNPRGPIQAFRFGHTEPFDTPIGLERVRYLARQTGAAKVVLQSPSRVPSDLFGAIYREGVQRGG